MIAVTVDDNDGAVNVKAKGSPEEIMVDLVVGIIAVIDKFNTEQQKSDALMDTIDCLLYLSNQIKERGWDYVHGQPGS